MCVCVYIEYSKVHSYFCDSLSVDETVMKEKIWALISQNEPSLVPITMVSIQQKLASGILNLCIFFEYLLDLADNV